MQSIIRINCIVFCLLFQQVKSQINTDKRAQLIKDPNGRTIIFSKKELSSAGKVRKILPNEIAVISDSGNKALIVDHGKYSAQTKAAVYNSYGDLEREFEVKTTAYCHISNDGKLVFFGGIPEESTSDGVWTKSHLFFYDSAGNKLESPTRSFGINILTKFSKSGKHFIFLADSVFSGHDPKVVELYIYNEFFNIIGYHHFNDWPLLSFYQDVVIDEDSGRIVIRNHRRGHFKDLIKQTLFFDFNGNIIKKKKGW